MIQYDIMLENAVKAVAQIAYDEASRVCPVRTGRLKRSISKRVFNERPTGRITATVGTDVPYAPSVEFGGYHRRPKPFLETGLEAARQSVPLVFSMTFGGGFGG
ncbi:MAG: HK97 gp10 family phage protein [Ruminiclostridium sp.]|nr:HK97 gp10 family phage protein [Ruminiclostridium sp.]